MILLLTIFLLSSQFHCVLSATKQGENVNLFNEFLENLLNKSDGTKQEIQKATLSLPDAAKILELLRKMWPEKFTVLLIRDQFIFLK